MTLAFELAVAITASIVGTVGVEAWRRVAQRHRILDVPNERSSHIWPTPRGGGFLIPLVVPATLVIAAEARQTLGYAAILSLVVSVAIVALVSLWDDLRKVGSLPKFIVHLVAAGVSIAAIGYPSVVWLPGVGIVEIGLAGVPVALIWIVGLTNAYNFMDGIDGIAGLQAFVTGVGWIVVGATVGAPIVGVFGALVAGVTFGFLLHNWPPARVFMGDVGSASLGFAFAVTTLMAGRLDIRLLTAGVLLLWPFLFDTSFTFLRRLRRRENVFTAHRTHLYQRLVAAGYPHTVVTSIYGLLAAMGLVCSWLLVVGATAAFGASLCAVALSAVTLWRLVERIENSVAPGGSGGNSAGPSVKLRVF